MERQQKELEQTINQNNFYRQDKNTISETIAKVKQVQTELEEAYCRWEYLAEFDT